MNKPAAVQRICFKHISAMHGLVVVVTALGLVEIVSKELDC